MPTILQSALLWLVIIGYSSITSIYMLAYFVIVWWRNRSTFFRKKIHPRPAVLDAPEWRHRNVRLSKVQLHIVECIDDARGDIPNNSDKPVMLFLHGFPEFWYSWRFQLRHFRDKFRPVAVDLRGYNDSDKPAGVANYEAEVLVADIIELIEVLGGNVILVGHDWGGYLSWIVATERPDLVQRLVIMNGPHGKFLTKIMRTKSIQLIKSWYMFFFQCPLLPEIWIWNNDFAMLGECFIANNKMSLVHKENFTAEDLEAWKYVFSKPNGITPPINYYRALMRAANRQIHYDIVRPKTLIIWGELDKALEMEIAELSVGICRDAKLVKIPDSSHWVQQDVPQSECDYGRMVDRKLNY